MKFRIMSEIHVEHVMGQMAGEDAGGDVVINVEGLYKTYLSEEVSSHGSSQVSKCTAHQVLNNINFRILRGEVVGVVGTNGSGKSTLLKILSGISKPTQGRVSVRGRVASILEIGTGFHPDLSGRENVYLSASVLGMTPNQVDAVYPSIVEFSGLKHFMDTAVKRYSSGMYMRLAFSVVAHLDADVIFLDEVLAVGDMGFQRKCEDRLFELSRQNKTVVIVSHDSQSIMRLTKKCIVLKNGKVECFGASQDVIERFIMNVVNTDIERADSDVVQPSDQSSGDSTEFVSGRTVAGTDNVQKQKDTIIPDLHAQRTMGMNFSVVGGIADAEGVEVDSVSVSDPDGDIDGVYLTSEELHISCRFRVKEPILALPVFGLTYQGAIPALIANPFFRSEQSAMRLDSVLKAGEYSCSCIIPRDMLNEGVFSVSVFFVDESPRELLKLEHAVWFRMKHFQGHVEMFRDPNVYFGPFKPRLIWKFEQRAQTSDQLIDGDA